MSTQLYLSFWHVFWTTRGFVTLGYLNDVSVQQLCAYAMSADLETKLYRVPHLPRDSGAVWFETNVPSAFLLAQINFEHSTWAV